MVVKPKVVSFPGLPATRKNGVKRASAVGVLELQQKFLGFGAALQQGARAPGGKHVVGGLRKVRWQFTGQLICLETRRWSEDHTTAQIILVAELRHQT